MQAQAVQALPLQAAAPHEPSQASAAELVHLCSTRLPESKHEAVVAVLAGDLGSRSQPTSISHSVLNAVSWSQAHLCNELLFTYKPLHFSASVPW